MPLLDTLISPILGQAKDIIAQFHLSPEDKAKADAAMAQLQQDATKQANDYEVQLNTIAGQNIRADAQSDDKFTQRARPLFMYIVEFILAFNYIGVPVAQMFGSKVQPINLPGDLLTLFGVCVTGYVFMRSAEKIAGLPGESTVNVLGAKFGNKS